jgi:hypothetical protein
MKAALYTLHYIHSAHDYSISFSAEDIAPMHSFIHFLPSTNVKAYKDAVPPKPVNSSTLSAYSDACWGSQIGSAIANGTLLPIFKFRSMNGGIIFCNGGHVGWIGKRQERTSLNSCEAEIWATTATSKKVVDFCNLCRSISNSGNILSDILQLTILYNNNDACVRWSYNMTFKAALHIELQENSVWEWVQNKSINVQHVSGKIKPADIFTKEMRNGAHFRHLWDTFMSRLSNFINDSLLATHHTNQQSPKQFVPSAAKAMLMVHPSSYFSALASSSICCTFTAISHLCSAGCQLLRNFHGYVPPHLI